MGTSTFGTWTPDERPTITLTEAMTNPALFGSVFGDPSFWTWKVVAKIIDGLPLTEKREIDLFEQCTGLKYRKTEAIRRLIILAGRRAGKDRFESAVATWRAALAVDSRTRSPSLRAITRKPSCLISCSHRSPEGN
jgi:hypothetical protein